MIGKHRASLLLPLLLLGVAGCTMAKISGRGAKPLMLNAPGVRMDVLAHISVSKGVYFDYTGAFDVSEVIAERLIGSEADALVNTVITIKATLPNFAVNVITFGIANARTFQISGDLVKFPEGLSSLEAAGYERIASAENAEELVKLLSEQSRLGSNSLVVKENSTDGRHLLAVWTKRLQ